MDHVYNIDWNDEHCVAGHNNVVTSAWSSSNLFVFTTQKEISGSHQHYINVVNPNQPWNVFSTLYKGGNITCLQWDTTGTRFLSGDSHGNCKVWSRVNQMSNVWSSDASHSVELPGEEVLAVRWLHSGVRIVFHIDKMEASNFDEKFKRSVFRPSAVQFGGKHLDGYILVTSTGLLHVHCFDSDKDPTFGRVYLKVAAHQRIADIRFTQEGKIFILTSTGDLQQLIQFHEVTLNYNALARTLSFEVTSLPGFTLKCAGEAQVVHTHISHAKFASHENQDYVIVCAASPSGSRFEGWVLTKKEIPLNRLFQQTTPASKQETTKSWQSITVSNLSSKVLDFSIPANAMDTSSVVRKIAQESKFFCGQTIAVTLENNSVQILNRLFLTPLLTYSMPSMMETNENLSSTPCLRSAIFSSLSCALVGVCDNGGLYLFKVPPWLNSPDKSPVEANKQTIELLFFCMITGQDWWEVLLHVSHGLANNVVDMMTTEMKKQTSFLQQSLHCRFLSMKITLYQLSNNAASTDCHLKLLFYAVMLVFRSLFRPPQQVTSEGTDPSLRLQTLCRTSNETDINQMLQHADANPQSLQAMQQLIQWVADVTLHLLASVPYHHMGKALSRPCSTLIKDRQWLTLLRELLVIIRVWGLLTSACSPIFHALDSKLEVLPHIFRLVTLLWQACSSESVQHEIPSSLINECCLLPSKVVIPPLEIISPVNGVLNHLSLSFPLSKLKFGESQCNVAVVHARQRRTELVTLPGASGKVDSLRRVFLGKRPVEELKECTRCGITAMYSNPRMSLLKMWEQRFVKACLCGGMWRKLEAG